RCRGPPIRRNDTRVTMIPAVMASQQRRHLRDHAIADGRCRGPPIRRNDTRVTMIPAVMASQQRRHLRDH
ncbi:hypothetical protein WA852_34270, partial [Pseudomonas aeruginosa]